jgi:release factor glutamine methyltransferase
MTIKEALKKYHKIEIELLLAHVLKKPKEFVFMHGEDELSSYKVIKLSSLIRRRLKGEPMAYILGYKDFYGLRFKVNRDVLIPRPETEMVVDLVLARLRSSPLLRGDALSSINEGQRGCSNTKLKQPLPDPLLKRRGGLRDSPIKILDLGTGSGNIIITLANTICSEGNPRKVEFWASDVSKKALRVARQNAKILLSQNSHTPVYGRIRFVKSDLLKNIKGNFDIIVANLPYGWTEWKNNSSAQTVGLKFEPKRALFAKEKGLMVIRKLLVQIAELKYQPKLVYLEFDPRQKAQLSKLIKKSLPGLKINFYKDYNNFWRYVEIR